MRTNRKRIVVALLAVLVVGAAWFAQAAFDDAEAACVGPGCLACIGGGCTDVPFGHCLCLYYGGFGGIRGCVPSGGTCILLY